MRLNKYLAQAGVASRRQAEEWILAGKVEVNGRLTTELSTQVEEGDVVFCEGKKLTLPTEVQVVALHKPRRFLCTQKDPQGRPLIYELLPAHLQHFHYVGRLDFESRGLLLLSNDGELSRRLTLPAYQIPRYYEVTLNRVLRADDQQMIEKGLVLEDGTHFRSAKVKVWGKKVEMRLTEGKKREIREMMRALGYRVVDLFRTAYGCIEIGDLAEGSWRKISTEELDELQKMVEQ